MSPCGAENLHWAYHNCRFRFTNCVFLIHQSPLVWEERPWVLNGRPQRTKDTNQIQRSLSLDRSDSIIIGHDITADLHSDG